MISCAINYSYLSTETCLHVSYYSASHLFHLFCQFSVLLHTLPPFLLYVSYFMSHPCVGSDDIHPFSVSTQIHYYRSLIHTYQRESSVYEGHHSTASNAPSLLSPQALLMIPILEQQQR